jgi:Flp pilus assembly pilin Flp
MWSTRLGSTQRRGKLKQSRNVFERLLRDTRGAGMVEYLIIVGVVAIAAQTGFRAFGKSVSGTARGQADTIAQIDDGSCVGGLCMGRTERPSDR